MSQIVSYGEALVDFLPAQSGVRLRDVESFTRTIGGAPANAAMGLARLGCDVALLGKIGEDEFGHFLIAELGRAGINVTAIRQTREAKTGITFISLDSSGDRSFLFFREPSADMTLRIEDVDLGAIDRCTIFIAGSNLLTEPGVRAATLFSLDRARSTGRFVVLDPNIRPHLWRDHDEMKAVVRRELDYGDVVKLNEEELALMGDSGAEPLWAELAAAGASALIVTQAAAGAEVFYRGGTLFVDAPSADVVDTTGAGDGFVAGLVCGLLRATGAQTSEALRAAVGAFTHDEWRRVLSLGCYVGTEVCKKLGATSALPAAADVPWDQFGM